MKKKYVVYVADRFTKIPLIKVEVKAWTKIGAIRIVKRELTLGDNGYIVVARKGA